MIFQVAVAWKKQLPSLILLELLRNTTQQSTMATVAPLILVPPGGAPAIAVTPQLPHGPDPDTITGWLLDATATEMWDGMSKGLEGGFNRLVDDIPIMNGAGYTDAMREMKDEILNSDTLIPYLVTTNIGNDVV